MAGPAVEVSCAGVLVLTSEVDELEGQVSTDVVERGPDLRIDTCRKCFGRSLDRLVEYFPAFGHPALEEDVEQVHLSTTEVLEDPGQHGGVLPVGGIVEHRRRLLTQAGGANPAGEGVWRQELPLHIKGLKQGEIDRVLEMSLQILHRPPGVEEQHVGRVDTLRDPAGPYQDGH